jgi:ubiquitin conjugation factor E4 B
MSVAIADRLLIARLSLDPQLTPYDPEEVTVVAGMPQNQSSFEYLVECWKRCGSERAKLLSRKGLEPAESSRRLEALEQIKGLTVSYAGLCLQDSSMFPQPAGKLTGSVELVPSVLHPSQASSLLPPHQLQAFLGDLARRFSPSADHPDEGSLPDILGPVVQRVAAEFTDEPARYTMAGSEWQEPLRALMTLSEIKPIAAIFPDLPTWNPNTHAALFELQSLLGPVMRIGCFPDRFVRCCRPPPTSD